MSIAKLVVQQLRNITAAELSLSPHLNFLIGDNGSGKSSLLEAINYLCTGRSFRTHLSNNLIQHQTQSFVLFGQIVHDNEIDRVGMERDKQNNTRVRHNGEAVDSISSVAKLLPIQVVTPDSYELLTGGPVNRRKFMDWGLFHVEQSFFNNWKVFQKVLKQRNSLLKKKDINLRELDYWDQQFCHYSCEISLQRERYCSEILGKIEPLVRKLLPQFEIGFNFHQGWERGCSLNEKLIQNRERDVKMGHTQSGSHKADFKLTTQGKPVAEVLSRGQLKLLVFALAVAQAELLFEQTNKHCLFLVDDLASELDANNRKLLFDRLNEIDCQLVITLVESQDLELITASSTKENKVFHVEHGQIKTT